MNSVNKETASADLNKWTDEALIKEFQNSSSVEAYRLLVKRYKDPLMNFLLRFVNDRDLAEDLLQETFMRLHINKHYYTDIAKFSTWIYTIASNLAKTELRKRKIRRFISIDAPITTDGGDEESFELPDPTVQADLIDAKPLGELIDNALKKMKPIYRELVVLRFIQELSYEEISEITGLRLGTVKSRINRGRIHIQKLLKPYIKDYNISEQ